MGAIGLGAGAWVGPAALQMWGSALTAVKMWVVVRQAQAPRLALAARTARLALRMWMVEEAAQVGRPGTAGKVVTGALERASFESSRMSKPAMTPSKISTTATMAHRATGGVLRRAISCD